MENHLLQTQKSFFEKIDSASSTEEGIRMCLSEMKLFLSEKEVSDFEIFWKMRQKCLELFKKKIPSRSRTLLWSEFIFLSDEMRKIKEVFNEEASFAFEQIELAVEAFSLDMEQVDQKISESPPIFFPDNVRVMKGLRNSFVTKQQELDFMSYMVDRLNSLRKELIHTQVRARFKSRLFAELSKLGDNIFPRRRKMILSLSEDFFERVRAFKIDKFHLHDSKEEIKALQALARSLTINAKVFNEVRDILSGFWDQIKEYERHRHEKKAKDRESFKKSLEILTPKIQLLTIQCRDSEIDLAKAREVRSTILAEMRELPLVPKDVKFLKKSLEEALEPLEKKQIEELKKKKELELLAFEEKEKSQKELMNSLSELLDRAELLDFDVLVEKWEFFVEREKLIAFEGIEKEKVNDRLDAVHDCIQEKLWQSLKEDQKKEKNLQIHALLDERHKTRRNLKKELENLRKTVGKSGLSLENSLFYQETIKEKKYRLGVIETIIEEIEEKLFDLGE